MTRHTSTGVGRRRIALAVLAVLLPAAADAVTATFELQPQTLTVGELGTAVFTISGADQAPPPQMPASDVIRVNPNAAQGMNFTSINGRTTRTVTYTYRFLALKEGAHPLQPPPYAVDGDTIEFAPVTLNVAPRDAAGGGSAELEDLLFARLTADRERVYLQEAFDVTLSVYSRDLNLGRDFRLQGLPTSGLSFQDFTELRGDREIIDGVVYDVRRFRARVRALTAGVFNVSPSVQVPIVTRQPARRRSIFDLMLDTGRTEAVEVVAEPLRIEVLGLPQEGRPTTFSGAVGQFEFEVRAVPLQVQAGDPVTVTMEISGRGNIDAVSAPALDLGPDFRVYDPRLLTKEMNEAQTLGRKVFEQVVIPRGEEVSELPPVAFSYFDPSAGSYRTLQRGPFALEVIPGTGAVSRVFHAAGGETAAPPETERRDIVYLKKAPDRWERTAAGRAWFMHPVFLGAQAVPALACLTVLIAVRRRKALQEDVAKARRLRAPRAARAGLESAAAAFKARDNIRFYEAVWDTLASYYGHLLNLAPGEITLERVSGALGRGGMSAHDLSRLREMFIVCEHARFGLHVHGDVRMTESDVHNARVIMETLEDVIQRSEKTGVAA